MARLFYSVVFAGAAGVIVFDDSGLVVGADAAGVTYDGTFTVEKGRLEAQVRMAVPPEILLVTRGPKPKDVHLVFTVNISVPMDDVMNVIPVETSSGPVKLQLKLIRTAP